MKSKHLSEQDAYGCHTLCEALLLSAKADEGIYFIEGADNELFVSYASLYEEALTMLGYLNSHGLTPGDELIIQTESNLQFLKVYWACLFGGILAVPLSLGIQPHQKEKVRQVIHNLNAPWIIGDEAQLARLSQYAQDTDQEMAGLLASRGLTLEAAEFAGVPAGEPAPIHGGTLAYLQFSSGSTGSPKGVMLTHANLLANTLSIAERSEINPADRMLSWMPLTHDMGLICFHLTGVVAGISQYLMPTPLFVRRPVLWLEKVNEHRASLIYSPNFGLQYFLNAFDGQQPDWDLSCLRLLYNGAEPISAELCHRFTERLRSFGFGENVMYPGYGLAEASVAVCLGTPGEEMQEVMADRRTLGIGQEVKITDGSSQHDTGLVAVGYAIPRTSVKITGEGNHTLPEGYNGRVLICGENVTEGYYNRPEETAKLCAGDGWKYTGDLGFIHNGRLVITGREKEMIIINGQNYYPADIEKIACKAEGAEPGKVIACGIQNEDGEGLGLFVLHKGKTANLAPLAKQMTALIQEEAALEVSVVIPVRRIPKTTSGKIRRFQMIGEYADGIYAEEVSELQRAIVSMTAEVSGLSVQEGLLTLWRDLFPGGDTLSAKSNLFAHGLSSLRAMQFANTISAKMGLHVSLQDIIDNPNVEQLTALLQTREGLAAPGKIQKLKEAEHYPASSGQTRMYMLHQLDGESTAYHITTSYHLQGKPDVAVIRRAIYDLTQRHESLRTSFSIVNGEVRQFVKEAPGDVFRESVADTLESAREKAEKFANAPFSLQEGPLFKVHYSSLADQSAVMTMVWHHIISDGWSAAILIRELEALYLAYVEEKESPLSVKAAWQFKEFVSWQQEQEASTKDTLYWKSVLSEEVESWDLPVVPVEQNTQQPGEAGILNIAFTPVLTTALKDFAQREQITLFSALYALVHLHLSRFSAQKSWVLGTDTAGRLHADSEQVVGYFLRTLPVPATTSMVHSFEAQSSYISRLLSDAFSHQQVAFEELVQDLKAEGRIKSELFNVLFILQDSEARTRLEGLEEAGIRATNLQVDNNHVLTDLHIEAIEREGQLYWTLRYNAGKYPLWQMREVAESMAGLAEGVMHQPDKPLHQLSLMGEDAGKRIAGFSRNPVHFSEKGSLLTLFNEQVESTYEATAIICEERRLSYGQLEDKVRKLAGGLVQKAGVMPGARVAVMAGRSEKIALTMLAIWWAGAVYIPVDPEYPAERIRFILQHSGAELLLLDKSDHMLPSDKVKTWLIDDLMAANKEVAPYSLSGADPAYMLFTSGSTGKPKGVLVPHRAILNYARAFAHHFQLSGSDVVVQQAAISFDTSFEEILPALISGACLAVAPRGGRDIDALAEVMTRCKASVLSTTPAVLDELNSSEGVFPALRLIISGGDVLEPRHISLLSGRYEVWNTYGPTETTVCATYSRVLPSQSTFFIGCPVPNVRVYVVDEHMNSLSAGMVGEIVIGGAGVALGYLDPLATEKAFVPDRAEPESRLYRTGDTGMWTQEGELVFLGRRDDQVKIQGYRIEPGEVEAIIAEQEGIQQACVVVARPEGNAMLAAFYTGTLSGEELRTKLMALLPVHMVPALLQRKDALPLTPNGKLDKKSLREQAVLIPADSSGGNLPETTTEKIVYDAFATSLGKSSFSTTDHFFGLGGHSLKAMRVLNRLAEMTGKELTIRQFYQDPTVCGLARMLDETSESMATELPVETSDSYPLTYAQRRLWTMEQAYSDISAYHIRIARFLAESTDVDTLSRAWQEVVKHHKILNTRIATKDGEPVQYYAPTNEAEQPEVADLRAEKDSEAGLLKLAMQHNRSFDLENGPLYRFTVCLLPEGKKAILITFHHIITDGWSLEVLREDLEAAYMAMASGETLQLQPSRVAGKVALMEAAWLKSEEARQHKTWWSNTLAAWKPMVFPFKKGFKGKRNFKGKRITDTVGAGLAEQIKETAAELTISVSDLFFGLYALSLHAICQAESLTIGTLTSGRHFNGMDRATGLFINFLPVTTRLSENGSLKNLLTDTAKWLSEVYSHGKLPFDLIAEEAPQAPEAGRNPLFDTMLVFHNQQDSFGRNTLTKDDAPDLPEEGAQLDFKMDIIPDGDRFTCVLEYDTERLDDQVAAGVMNAFRYAQGLLKTQVDSVGEVLPKLREVAGDAIYAQKERKSKLRVAATFTPDPLEDAVNYWAGYFALPAEVLFAPYNQVFRVLIDEEFFLQDSVNLILFRPEDWIRDVPAHAEDQALQTLERTFERFTTLVSNYPGHLNIMLLPHRPGTMPVRVADRLAELRQAYREVLHANCHVHFIDGSQLNGLYSIKEAYDAVQDHIGHIPYTDAFFAALGTESFRLIRAARAGSAKVIAVDCDNTLWQGIVGEDGVEGLTITGGHAALQRFLIEKYEQGFLLALISKNNEKDVWEVFDNHPDMLLRREHILSYRINWQTKSGNLESLAREINVGTDSFLFIDDSAPECREVSMALPSVMTVQWPREEHAMNAMPRLLWALDKAWVTDEDKQRTAMYRAERQRNDSLAHTTNHVQYLAELGLEVSFRSCASGDMPRMAQLLQRTNQFNIFPRRKDQTELSVWLREAGHYGWAVEVKDMYGAYGLTGVVLAVGNGDILQVESLLLSCRVLGRGVETALMSGIKHFAHENGFQSVTLQSRQTGRNAPALAFLSSLEWDSVTDEEAYIEHVAQTNLLPECPAYLVLHYDQPLTRQEEPVQDVAITQVTVGKNEAAEVPGNTMHDWTYDMVPVDSPYKKLYQPLKLNTASRILSAMAGAERDLVSMITPVAPKNEMEATLLTVWQQVLAVKNIGVTHPFFSAGGTSLKAVRLVSAVRKATGHSLDIRWLFDDLSIRELAGRMSREMPAEGLETIPVLPGQISYALSDGQRRLWVLQEMEGNASAYNETATYELSGPVDTEALEDSLEGLIRRHESLRTIIKVLDKEPRQVILPIDAHGFVLETKDMAGRADAEERIKDEKQRVLHAPFDLENGPLVRASLLRLGHNCHLLLFATHHIASDGWSVRIMMDEVRKRYSSGGHAGFEPLTFQYRDFAGWFNQQLEAGKLEEARTWWLNQFKGAIPVLNLVTDSPRLPVRSTEGAEVEAILNRRLTRSLMSLAASANTTMHNVLATAMYVLLYRYTAQTSEDIDIVLGTPVAGREGALGLENQVGYYANTLAVRMAFDEDLTFDGLLRKVHDKNTQAFLHQMYPFDRLVKELNAGRDASRTPLFDVAFTFHEADEAGKGKLGEELTISEIHDPACDAKFDLNFQFTFRQGVISLHIEYSRQLFREERISRMATHLLGILQAAIAHPEQTISQLDYLPEAEKIRLMERDSAMNQATMSTKCLQAIFQQKVIDCGDSAAVISGDKLLTYTELNAEANRLARHLISRCKVGRGERVGIFLERDQRMIVAILATLKAGAAYVPVDMAYPAERRQYIIDDAGLTAIITTKDFHDQLPAAEVQVVTWNESLWQQQEAHDLEIRNQPEDLAYIIYTSGSTGNSKGCMVAHQNACSLFENTRDLFGFSEKDTWIVAHSFSFDFSVWEMYGALLFGGRLVVPRAEEVRDLQAFLGLLHKYQITVLNQTPPAFLQLASLEEAMGDHTLADHLRLVIFGGDRLEVSRLKPWTARYPADSVALVNMFGITETTVHVTYKRIFQEDIDKGGSPVGKPLPGYQVYILDRQANLVPEGVAGELYVAGTGVAMGYHNRVSLTASRFVQHEVFGRLYRSGDLGYLLSDGSISYAGRIDHQVKIRGHRIEPGEIEHHLNQHGQVSSAAVLAVGNGEADKALVAYVDAAKDTSADVLKSYLQERVPAHLVPAHYVFLDTMPLTANNKVDRRALLAIDWQEVAGNRTVHFVAPEKDTEKWLARMWQEVLECDQVGMKDNFFDLGGTSLKLVTLYKTLYVTLPDRLQVADLFKYNTLEDLHGFLYPGGEVSSADTEFIDV
ncbi:amino acid adenylation domain-containing protein [Roseivirga sp. BDSF3-8]|uniref:amino acid adenylation domain-containing protein n=1 Tax=Roseivirga sp. BDSF3-8 TaxID=3241598 RepID=UPI0035318C44